MDACTRSQLKLTLGKLRNRRAQAERALPVASPCINVCKMDGARGLCIGCMRTLDEIAAWSALPDAARVAIWRQLPERARAWLEDTDRTRLINRN
ncbi:DUF1289 domain-containing protein [Ralstonia pseudosolanacearum]|uniref:DUF1289 domain-containing protein n=1 Tax=Ralstonia pseudosolanacearum TaxID=1310165 RepID=UPI0008D912EE|nr:DUF1289 domain-containing protein [Ralstonia pseudosolanacearum]AZU57331.1 DUF1289 domain-containing protein [Ralstonia solanacearum]MCK4139341.1 DUF1289 domain-containing protein [Ralstonia pseudosolanacearum]OHU97570.1 Fe-S protein [Ralstonia solanacearum]QVX37167.1 DUF1289 domain-containing protein [Ralstonia solanacearum]RAA07375.1 DUF1289 domain-containing protein [Ralstonia pseudosolanacearum]